MDETGPGQIRDPRSGGAHPALEQGPPPGAGTPAQRPCNFPVVTERRPHFPGNPDADICIISILARGSKYSPLRVASHSVPCGWGPPAVNESGWNEECHVGRGTADPPAHSLSLSLPRGPATGSLTGSCRPGARRLAREQERKPIVPAPGTSRLFAAYWSTAWSTARRCLPPPRRGGPACLPGSCPLALWLLFLL